MTLFSGQEWVFQQDSVPAQKPRRLRSGCGGTFRPLSALRIVPRGVQTSNPGTVSGFGGHGLPIACNNLDSLKRSLVKATAENTLETVRAAIAEWPERLKAGVEAEGGKFEWHYYE